MPDENLKQRTKRFALRIIRMVESLPETKTANVIGSQILRSGTSIGANYRAGCLAKSKRDCINKLKIVEEEADETIYWLELLEESGIVPTKKLLSIKQEACEIFSIIVARIRTARKNQKSPPQPIK